MKILNYIQLLAKYNTLKVQYEALNNNFMHSSYKHILNYENEKRQVEQLEDKLLSVRKENAMLRKDYKVKKAIEDLEERKNKNGIKNK